MNRRFSRNVSPTLCIILVILLASFFCFWNLGQRSIGAADESIHVRVIQEMRANSSYFAPTLDGQP